MIPLRKLPDDDPKHGPAIKKLRKRDTAYRAALANDEDVEKYKKYYSEAGVKKALESETHEKCAYCESKYLHVDYGDVEHVLPKSNDLRRLLDYDNLTVACGLCNNKKTNREYIDGYGLLDPFNDPPAEYLFALGTMLWPADDYARYIRAKRTIDDIDLNRTALIDRRKDFLERCHTALREYRNTPGPMKEMAARNILAMMQPESEYSAVATAFFKVTAPELMPAAPP